ncbi:hypothetical protein [Vibrio harveyi]
MTKSKMIKRLDWIDPKNPEQASWICTYLKARNLGSDKADIEGFIDPVGEFIKAASEFPENAYTRELMRNMKAAWKQWEKREKNRTSKKISEGAYTISLAARKELEKLAKQKKTSFSKVIESLLMSAKDIEKLQRELKKELDKDKRLRRYNIDFFSTILSDDAVTEQAKLLTQELETKVEDLKVQLSELTDKNKQLENAVKEAQDELHDDLTGDALS